MIIVNVFTHFTYFVRIAIHKGHSESHYSNMIDGGKILFCITRRQRSRLRSSKHDPEADHVRYEDDRGQKKVAKYVFSYGSDSCNERANKLHSSEKFYQMNPNKNSSAARYSKIDKNNEFMLGLK